MKHLSNNPVQRSFLEQIQKLNNECDDGFDKANLIAALEKAAKYVYETTLEWAIDQKSASDPMLNDTDPKETWDKMLEDAKNDWGVTIPPNDDREEEEDEDFERWDNMSADVVEDFPDDADAFGEL